jgi:protein TonB
MREDSARQFGEQDARTLELNKQIQEMERELERARNLYANSLRLQQASSVVAREELAKIAGPATSGATGLRFAAPGTINREPVRVGGTVKPPARLRNVNPEYPPVAMQARVQGVVILDVIIDEQGRIIEARVLRSIPLLDQAALDAVRQWEYAPTMLNGAPVPVKMTVTVNFTLAPEPQ